MRANRLLSILIRLQLRGRVTAQALAEEFAVSVRTIYRDVDQLSASGVPVYADRGRHGGFQLLDGYETHLTGLAAGEAEALLLAGVPGPAAHLGLAKPVAVARLKLLAAVSPGARRAAIRVGERFHLDADGWYRHTTPPVHLRAIAEAVWTERRIRVRYESWSATTERRLDPLGLVVKAGVWYVVARGGAKGIRIYKVANVHDLWILDEIFDYPAGFDLGAYWRKELKLFEASLRTSEAVVRVSSAAVRRLNRLDSVIEQAILQVPPDSSGWRQATIPIESISHAADLLLAFADGVEVLEPPALRRELAARAQRTASLYRPRRRRVRSVGRTGRGRLTRV